MRLLLLLSAGMAWAQPFPGTLPLTRTGDLSREMLREMDAYLTRSAVKARDAVLTPGEVRERIGLRDARVRFAEPELKALRKTATHEVFTARWPVVEGVEAEGLVYRPAGAATRCWIALHAVEAPGAGELVMVPSQIGVEPVGKGRHPQREHLYRMAYPAGRHVLGFEVQKVLAAVDYCVGRGLAVRVTGHGEGGLVALYSTFVDERIGSAVVGGLRGAAENAWQESLEHNLWKMPARPVSTRVKLEPDAVAPGAGPVASEREFGQWVEFCQKLMRQAERRRGEFWAKADLSSPEAWAKTRGPYLEHYEQEIIGKIATAPGVPRVETRRIYDTVDYTGYEIYVPLDGALFGYGILLVPKSLKPGERRPLVVAQHGLEGRPRDLIEPLDAKAAQTYGRFAARLAERGFVVYAPQNPYIHGDNFRVLQRKANPLGLTLYSFIVAQHKKSLDWLETLPMVDKERIGFYGLSYGGRTAMMVPPVEPRYKVVICSGNFNEWTWKIASNEVPFSYLWTRETEMFDFDLANTFGHYELAAMMGGRAFMVERGHSDGVGIDEWVSYEYAKVRRLYANWHLGERTRIEYFQGPHQIWGVGTFAFLHEQLRWP